MNVRAARAGDAAAIATLAGELGYPSSEEQMSARLAALRVDSDIVLVATMNEDVVGWIHIAIIHQLESDAFAEIRGLVVTATERGNGTGSQLVAAAEEWARERATKIRVRSNITRIETRAFYEKRGYIVTKTQNVFDKKLTP
jgi:GNAT superfamily N-acetyltransferase